MRMDNIEDLPYEPGSILDNNQKDNVIEYCENDLNATHKFFLKSGKHIKLRESYTEIEKMNLINASEITMSKKIFGKHLAKFMGIKTRDLKKMQSPRKRFPINDIIFDYIQFEDPVNKEILNKFKTYNWVDTSKMSKEQKKKHAIKFTRKYKNVVREYAEGGLHSFGKSGIYESDDEYILIDVDFASYYPHLCFRNNLHPEHIPEKTFNTLYEGFYTERKKYPKTDPRNYVLKIILNGSYGLSKDKYSFLYDPKLQMAICVNGQLILTMLSEAVFKYCSEETKIIFENTDGAMYRIKRSDIDNLNRACKEVEQIVDIPLETQECKKIIAADVNNYINIITDDVIKYKGRYEINRDYHKNHSKRIVALGAANYFINGVSPSYTIKNHFNIDEYNLPMDKKANSNIEEDKDKYQSYGIYDFCIGSKMKGDNVLYKREINGVTITDTKLTKTNRYYVSNGGYELIKKLPPTEENYKTDTDKYKEKVDMNQLNIFDEVEDVRIDPDDRESNLEAGWKCTLFNKYTDTWDINNEYYINEINKLINFEE